MSSRASLWTAIALLACAVVVRAFPFVWWTSAHFDSDQGVVGLMAKHISEGRAWPLYFYGQNYMLAVEAYLAAPLMWVFGVTVLAVKLPLVLINVAIVAMLAWLLVHDVRLSPWVAVIPALPIALPAAGIAARTTEAMGGNVEPWLYVLLLWWLRDRPFALGLTLGVGVLHREFTAYGAAALLVMDAVAVASHQDRRGRLRERLRHWALAGVIFVAVRVVAASLEPFASTMGPGTTPEDRALLTARAGTMRDRLCFVPDTWDTRVPQLLGDHLPRLVGGKAAPLQDYRVLSGVYSGREGLQLWVAAITLTGLASGAWHWWSVRRRGREAPLSHFGAYLVLVGAISTVVYGFWACTSNRRGHDALQPAGGLGSGRGVGDRRPDVAATASAGRIRRGRRVLVPAERAGCRGAHPGISPSSAYGQGAAACANAGGPGPDHRAKSLWHGVRRQLPGSGAGADDSHQLHPDSRLRRGGEPVTRANDC